MTTQRIAELEAEVMRLREALGKLLDSHEECTDFDGFTAQIVSMDDYHEAQEAIFTPFTSTALNELVEEVERRTIERCIGRVQGFHYLSANFKALEEELQSLPIGQIKLEELLK